MTLARRLAQLAVGLFLYGIAIALMVRAAIGVGPWDVFGQGLARVTGLNFGLLINVVGALVLLLWIPLRQRPGVGTVLNVFLIGPSAEVGLALIPAQDALGARIPLFAAGLVLLAIASGLYIGARLGPGPRDGLMTGIHSRFGLPIWAARTLVELAVLAVGWVLGGNVGIGTLAFALLIGPMVGVTLPLLRVPVTPPASRTELTA
ncbi:membrane protein [soil metagenome]